MVSELVSFDTLELPMPAADPGMLEMLLQPRLALFWGSSTPTRALLAALTVLASRGHPIRVFDGGNRFDGYFIARLARRLSNDPHATLERIQLSRAFTCFQLAELIENTPGGGDFSTRCSLFSIYSTRSTTRVCRYAIRNGCSTTRSATSNAWPRTGL
jgi:hypothetical protein